MNLYNNSKRKTRKRRRLKKPIRWILIVSLALILVFTMEPFIADFLNKTTPFSAPGRVDLFRDLNEVHLRYAQAKGITPIATDRIFQGKIGSLTGNGSLIKISDNDYYVIKKLTHSHPYLVPEAASLLDQIGKRFQQKTTANKMGKYYFRVSSVLRTQESQRRLRSVNGNASTNTSHFYGTTFDITYKNLVRKSVLGRKIVSHPEAVKLLSETIGELRKEKRLVVVTERNESCFHITVR